MTDLCRDALRQSVDECARRPELFDDDELAGIHIIGVRVEHGLALSPNQQRLLDSGLRRISTKGVSG